MKRFVLAGLAGLAFATCWSGIRAADCGCGHHGSCTDQPCVPACKATWEDVKTKKPEYSMKCEYACARGRDSWHAPPPECRCSPPCGTPYVKKRLYKSEGKETVEKVPKYDVDMRPAGTAGCTGCEQEPRLCWWNPLHLLSCFHAP